MLERISLLTARANFESRMTHHSALFRRGQLSLRDELSEIAAGEERRQGRPLRSSGWRSLGIRPSVIVFRDSERAFISTRNHSHTCHGDASNPHISVDVQNGRFALNTLESDRHSSTSGALSRR
jgi:hypothetical protein